MCKVAGLCVREDMAGFHRLAPTELQRRYFPKSIGRAACTRLDASFAKARIVAVQRTRDAWLAGYRHAPASRDSRGASRRPLDFGKIASGNRRILGLAPRVRSSHLVRERVEQKARNVGVDLGKGVWSAPGRVEGGGKGMAGCELRTLATPPYLILGLRGVKMRVGT